MRVVIACPHPRGSRSGNRRTAERWARLSRALGHTAVIVPTAGPPRPGDVLIALHARHSAGIVRATRAAFPTMPIALALTGTDLSNDIRVDRVARGTLALADLIVVLHDLAPLEVPARHRARVRVVRQSATAPSRAPRRRRSTFEVAVVGHLRDVKDPLRTALAARLLPAESRVHVVHAGAALEPNWEELANGEASVNARYTWLGELSPARSLSLIARARLFVLTSIAEGGANVLGEAVMSGTPVLASDIAAARAALGDDYPGLFPVGDTRRLAELLARAEGDPAWLADLARRVRRRRSLFTEATEKRALRSALRELERLRR